MIYAALFACALGAGWAAAIGWGYRSERETMCLLTLIWAGTVGSNAATGDPSPVVFYAALDIAGLVWLYAHQRRNWQWIPAGLFAAMMLTHFVFWSGTGAGVILQEGRPYQDILAVLAYMQIACVGLVSHERARQRRKQHPFMGDWVFATGGVLRFRRSHKNHARAPG